MRIRWIISNWLILLFYLWVGLSLLIWLASALISMLGAFCFIELGMNFNIWKFKCAQFWELQFVPLVDHMHIYASWSGNLIFHSQIKIVKKDLIFRYSLAFSYMIICCFISYPSILAIQAETFAEYALAVSWFYSLVCSSSMHWFRDQALNWTKLPIIGHRNLLHLHWFVS